VNTHMPEQWTNLVIAKKYVKFFFKSNVAEAEVLKFELFLVIYLDWFILTLLFM